MWRHKPLIMRQKRRVKRQACMRKQLTILNTMMKNGTHWEEKLA